MSGGILRIENVRSIKNFRIFQGWNCPSSFAGFSDINLIYANNGTGKSTLASLLAPSQSADGWAAGVALEVSEQGQQIRDVISAQDPLWDRVSVFNKAYVAECFDFEVGEAKALLAIGKANVDRERDLRAARLRLDELARETRVVEKVAKQKDAAPQTILKNIGTLVTSTLGGVEGYGRGYNARTVLSRLPQAMTAEDRATFEVEAELERAQSTFIAQVSLPHPPTVKEISIEALGDALALVPTARLVDSLASHPDHADWVQEGLALHGDSTTCLFCTGPLTQQRMEVLNRHFDESTVDLQRDLRNITSDIEDLTTALVSQQTGFPDSGLLYPEYRKEYDILLRKLIVQGDETTRNLAALQELVDLKLKSLHQVSSLPEPWTDRRYSLPDTTPIQELIGRHNERSLSFSTVRKAACEQLEAFWIGEQEDAYATAIRESEAANGAVEINSSAVKATRDQIIALENEELDPAPPAQWLNQRLHTLLGRSDIRIEPAEDNRYAIYRHGEPAFNLSEGECTALALLYFVRSLSTHGRNRREQIVVIDDPVSSLDDNFAVGASSLLWSELVHPSVCGCGRPVDCSCNEKPTRDCGQVFLMTHNFELFRIWSNQLDRLPGNAPSSGRAFKILELQAKVQKIDVGVARRVPTWRDWGSDRTNKALRTRLRSEYHYLFWRAATTLIDCGDEPTIEQEMDAAIILPNVCRRLLEGFLSFRFPVNMGDFRVQMQAAIDSMDDGLTRQRLVTYLHQHSHQERVETTRGVNRPEAVQILHAVFELISNEDRKHFTAMCAALNLNPDLLAQRAPGRAKELETA
jgi:wobble nucleotide-excising tRNase